MLTLLAATLCWLVALDGTTLRCRILTPFVLRNTVGEIATPQRILNWFCIPAPVLIASLLAAVPSAPFSFLLLPLEVGWCKVARRELCSSVLLVLSSSSPLPLNAFTDAAWSAGASSMYSRQIGTAIKVRLCIFLCGNLLVEANLRRAVVSNGGTHS